MNLKETSNNVKVWLFVILAVIIIVGLNQPVVEKEIENIFLKKEPRSPIQEKPVKETIPIKEIPFKDVSTTPHIKPEVFDHRLFFSTKWEEGSFTDEFGDEISGSGFIKFNTTGMFSNRVTKHSDLYVGILISKDGNIKFDLNEYSISGPSVYFIGDNNFVGLKDNLRNKTLKINNKLFKWNNSGGLGLTSSSFIKFLKESKGKVDCVIKDGHSSVYVFLISTLGFKESYNKMKGITTVTQIKRREIFKIPLKEN